MEVKLNDMTGSTETESSYKEKHTDQLIDLSNVLKNSPIRELVKKLSVNRSSYDKMPKGSIMEYENICNHDSAYLCECRLQYIVDFLNKKMTKI